MEADTEYRVQPILIFCFENPLAHFPKNSRLGQTWASNVSSSGYASHSWSSIKTGTRRIIRLYELSYVVRLERRTTEDSSTRRIIRLVPVFMLDELRDS